MRRLTTECAVDHHDFALNDARKIDLDLYDGVKRNYLLFGFGLRKIPGLDAKED